jgi:hypothetical protein
MVTVPQLSVQTWWQSLRESRKGASASPTRSTSPLIDVSREF